VLAFVAARLSPALAWWMTPLFAGMILSIPISHVTGSVTAGRRLRAWGIFVTPDETTPEPELQRFTAALSAPAAGKEPLPELASNLGVLQAVLDPYVNAAHVSLLRAKDDPPIGTELRLAELREKLLAQGPDALNVRDRVALLSDVDSMVALHEAVWAAPSSRLAPWWQLALHHYDVVAPPPQTAFTRAA
jgi:membrane glycosyltransferase